MSRVALLALQMPAQMCIVTTEGSEVPSWGVLVAKECRPRGVKSLPHYGEAGGTQCFDAMQTADAIGRRDILVRQECPTLKLPYSSLSLVYLGQFH